MTAVEPEVAAGTADIVNVEVAVDVETVTLVAAVVETSRSDKRTTESIYLHAATIYSYLQVYISSEIDTIVASNVIEIICIYTL